jgi:hypothetical protein
MRTTIALLLGAFAAGSTGFHTALAADMSAPMVEAAPPAQYAPPPGYGYPPPAPPPVVYYSYPAPVVVAPQAYYWRGPYWGYGPRYAYGYGYRRWGYRHY